jgi:hypothetical protein
MAEAAWQRRFATERVSTWVDTYSVATSRDVVELIPSTEDTPCWLLPLPGSGTVSHLDAGGDT